MGDQPNDRQVAAAADRAEGLAKRAWVLIAAAVVFAVTGYLSRDPLHAYAAVAIAGTLVCVAGWLAILARLRRRRIRKRLDDIMVFVEHDMAAAFCTDLQGAIMVQNRAAADRFGAVQGDVLSRVLEPIFANPDSVVHRLRSTVKKDGAAREDVVTRRGHVRLSVTGIPGGELWRLEDMIDRPMRTGDGIGLPMLTVSASGTILFMNESLRGAIGRRAKRLSDVFDDLPLRNGGIHQLRRHDGGMAVRIAVSRPVSDRKEIFVLPVEEGGDQPLQGGMDALLDTLPIALARIENDGTVGSLNRAALKLLPRGAEGDVPLAALVEGLGRSVGEWVAEGIKGRGLYRPEVVRVTGAGEAYLQITLGRPIEKDGRGLIAVLNDATELKSIEAQFVQSQKMQAIGQLAGGVAHDFNNLLTAITGHCDLLLLRRGEDDPDFADLSQINQNANRAAALVGQLLAFSRKQTLKMQDLDLRDTLGDMTHLLNRLLGERVRLVVVHDKALIPIRGDRRQLEQVLMNLVVNARDAMPEGGEVRIETECRYLDAGLSRDQVTVPPGQYVIVRVADQGRGIEPEKIGRIFEPFFTTKRPGEGTGLGLSMAYGIVKQSGGYIFADSQPGQGATFSLYLPAGRDAADIAESPAAVDGEMEASAPASPAWVETVLSSDRSQKANEAGRPAFVSQQNALVAPGSRASSSGSVETPEPTEAMDAKDADAEPAGPDATQRAEGAPGALSDEDAGRETTSAFQIDAFLTELSSEEGLDALSDGVTDPDAEVIDPVAKHGAAVGPTAPAGAGSAHDAAGLIAETFGQDEVPPKGASDGPARQSASAEPGARANSEAEAVRAEGETASAPDAAVVERKAEDQTTADEFAFRPIAAAAEISTAPQADAGAPGPSQLREPSPERNRTVLLVEDEAPVRAFASRALRLKGYTVVEAACAEDALSTLDDRDLEVDLFVTDVMMPGLDGPTWVRQALLDRPDVRTIFVSGYTQDTMSETSVPVPNSYFLPKPFSLADLTRTVQRALQ